MFIYLIFRRKNVFVRGKTNHFTEQKKLIRYIAFAWMVIGINIPLVFADSPLFRYDKLTYNGQTIPAGDYRHPTPEQAFSDLGMSEFYGRPDGSTTLYFYEVEDSCGPTTISCSGGIKVERCYNSSGMSPVTRDLWRANEYRKDGKTSPATEYVFPDGLSAIESQAISHYDNYDTGFWNYHYWDLESYSCTSDKLCSATPVMEKCGDGMTPETRNLWRYNRSLSYLSAFNTNPDNVTSGFGFGGPEPALEAQGKAIFDYEAAGFTSTFLYYKNMHCSGTDLLDGGLISCSAYPVISYCRDGASCITTYKNIPSLKVSRGRCSKYKGSNIYAKRGACPFKSIPATASQEPKNLGNDCDDIDIMHGNPLNTATGNKFQAEVDYQSSGAFPLQFVRYYNSLRDYPNSENPNSQSLGVKWSHTYGSSIERLYEFTEVEPKMIRMHRPDGRMHDFRFINGAWVIVETDRRMQLVETAEGWLFKQRNREEKYNNDGFLTAITDASGLAQNLSYDADLRLVSVTTTNANLLAFEYDDDNHISRLITSDGAIYQFEYDLNGNLISVIHPDETPIDFSDNPTRRYLYENNDFPAHLTGIIDERENRYATWTYDTKGRAVTSSHFGGIDNTAIKFNWDGTTTATNSLGKKSTLYYDFVNGRYKVRRVEGHPTSLCSGENKYISYGSYGLISSKTDWKGNTTSYTYNDRGLEISRVEAAGTPEERLITTEWHPLFDKPTSISGPGKSTHFTYDTEGRLLGKTESILP
ncbi:MAG: hypothetical protein KZQ80_12910 [Candidatus Thiodiazotropha sp. (ex Monitilora ramsayi)]|nr:hypothetical protein [Candidatus Thiodiazotropha sp. (ex Monitilora ramsayi)]